MCVCVCVSVCVCVCVCVCACARAVHLYLYVISLPFLSGCLRSIIYIDPIFNSTVYEYTYKSMNSVKLVAPLL